jgi:predicted dehydrogenase
MDLVAIASTKSREEIARIGPFSGPLLADYRELAGLLEGIDGIVLATPPEHRPGQIDFFLDRGVPVFAEKPLTLRAGETLRLLAKARLLGVPLIEDFLHVYSWPYRSISSQLGSGPVDIESCGGNDGPLRTYTPLFDWGPHDLAMSLQIFRCRPQRIAAGVFNVKSRRQFCVNAELDFGPAGTAVMSFGNAFDSKRRWFRLSDATNEWVADLQASKLQRNGVEVPPEANASLPLTAALESFVGHRAVLTAAESAQLSDDVAVVLSDIERQIAPHFA